MYDLLADILSLNSYSQLSSNKNLKVSYTWNKGRKKVVIDSVTHFVTFPYLLALTREIPHKGHTNMMDALMHSLYSLYMSRTLVHSESAEDQTLWLAHNNGRWS